MQEKQLLCRYLLYLFSVFMYYSYYMWYPLCWFAPKRFYSNIPEISKFSSQYKEEFQYELTKEQKEAIIGIILADLERGKLTYNTRLRVEHTYPEQESYILLLHSIFAPLIATEPKIVVRKADSRTGNIYKSMSVRTLRFPWGKLTYNTRPTRLPYLPWTRGIYVNSTRFIHNVAAQESLIHCQLFRLLNMTMLIFTNYKLLKKIEANQVFID